MKSTSSRIFLLCTVLAASLLPLCVVQLSHAEGRQGSKHSNASLLPAYKQECAACHLAYPPQLLPAASWQALMTNLPRHFGSDASLEPQMVTQLSIWLNANAAESRRIPNRPPEDRITRFNWFVREHHEVPTRIWQLATVKNGANCAACHTRAAQGDFNERFVHLPQ